MVLSYEEQVNFEREKHKLRMEFLDKTHNNTLIELNAQLKIEAMKALGCGKLSQLRDVEEVRKIVFEERENE